MKRKMKLASRGKRFAAGMIDMAVPLLAYIIMVTVFGMSSFLTGGPSYNSYGYGYGYGYGYNYGYNTNFSGGSLAAMVVLLIILIAYIVVELVFYARAQSIGKAILGLKVISSIDGKPFGFWKMMLRECIVKTASGYVFFLGYIWILIDDKNRGWHDKILDSYVIDLKETAKMNAQAPVQRRAASAEQAPAQYQPERQEPETPAAPQQPAEPEPRPAAPQPEEPRLEAPQQPEKPEPVEVQPRVTEAEPEAEPEPAEEQPQVTEAEPEAEIPVEVSVTDEKAEMPKATMNMTRDELLKMASDMGLNIISGATKPEIIDEINKAAGGKQTD